MSITAKPTPVLLESTIGLATAPYDYISRQCRRLGSDVFVTRLLLRKTTCMTGPAAAELFYDETRFRRAGAAPSALSKTLFGVGGVQGLDDQPHKVRKAMFQRLATAEHAEIIAEKAHRWLCRYADKWSKQDEIELYAELHEVLCRAACEWLGVPLADEEVQHRTHQLMALFDYAGSRGPRHLWARWQRVRADAWMERIVRKVRSGALAAPADAPLRMVAEYVDANGKPMSDHVAAVEVLNLLRPTIAVSVYIVFVALALHEHAYSRERIASGADAELECFAQEVRRFYPFFPCLVAETRETFEWQGHAFPKGRRVLLDIYGTNHDPRAWEEPWEFRPERFVAEAAQPFSFLPQGGGDANVTHRCPGERIAIELMKMSAAFFTKEVEFDVPKQDLRVDRTRLPALPVSRFRLSKVRRSSSNQSAV